ncbi:hypothetical protein G3M58_45145 [Streptomyces sp. SID7499]|uniref:Uncharacterized protein n=1 Tax=Streptomyces sp. SID7499 TaxID=2706086 RepID=A0A6G3X7I7_9ACTN|nr:hypothetical protein [Streptomyces sp. SID7499]
MDTAPVPDGGEHGRPEPDTVGTLILDPGQQRPADRLGGEEQGVPLDRAGMRARRPERARVAGRVPVLVASSSRSCSAT